MWTLTNDYDSEFKKPFGNLYDALRFAEIMSNASGPIEWQWKDEYRYTLHADTVEWTVKKHVCNCNGSCGSNCKCK